MYASASRCSLKLCSTSRSNADEAWLPATNFRQVPDVVAKPWSIQTLVDADIGREIRCFRQDHFSLGLRRRCSRRQLEQVQRSWVGHHRTAWCRADQSANLRARSPRPAEPVMPGPRADQ